MIYLVVLFLLVILSFHYDINGKTEKREFWYRSMLVVFILVAGLRWRIGIDTPGYLYRFYHEYPPIDHFSWDDYPIGKDPFYVLINSIVKSFGGRFYLVQLIHASLVNVLVFHFIKKHSQYIFTCLFFYAITCYTTYNMEIMRGSLSIVLCLYANDYILGKQWFKGYMLLFIALMFHAQTILLFILPFIYFLRFNKLGVSCLFVAYLLGIVVNSVMGDYLFLLEEGDTISDKMNAYAQSDKYGDQDGGWFFFLFYIIVPIIYLLISLAFVKYKTQNSLLLKYEPFLMIGIALFLVRMNLEIVYRYIDYFKIHFLLFYSEMFVCLITKTRKLKISLAYTRSVLLFFPFLFAFFGLRYVYRLGDGYRYQPYVSIFKKTVVKERELKYDELNVSKSTDTRAKVSEY